jgi:hypothetical protein
MATTVSSFSAIDDTEVDADSPVTESLMTRMRDNSYWIDPASTRTTATSNTLVLTPNQSAGTTQWQEITTLGSLDGTKGAGTWSTSSGAPTQIAIQTDKLLVINTGFTQSSVESINGNVVIDASDDTFAQQSSNASGTGTLTGVFGNILNNTVGSQTLVVLCRKNGSNYEFYESGTGATVTFMYYWL